MTSRDTRVLDRKPDAGGRHVWLYLYEVLDAIRSGGSICYLDEYDVVQEHVDPLAYLHERIDTLKSREARAKAAGMSRVARTFERTHLELTAALAEVLPH